jgi:hypothetical protein
VPELGKKTTQQTIFEALEDFYDKHDKARSATNAVNRAKSLLNKLFPKFFTEKNLPFETKIQVLDKVYSWGVTEGTCIDPVKWHQMWVNEEITEEQYFSCIKVGKEDAVVAIGEDQVATIQMSYKGTKADVRISDAEKLIANPKIIKPIEIAPAKSSGLKLQVPAKSGRKMFIRKVTK